MRYELVDTPAALDRAAGALAAGRGPFALDTERASAFRFDDRAFLVQVHRRGGGTFLVAPEGMRNDVREVLAPVIDGADWILHAAAEDLPSLDALGLRPGTLFDTELGSRLAGYEHTNLAAMVEEFTGVRLEKGHGREDWSTAPLPRQWQDYAAYDVVYLNELAEGLAELLDSQGKLDAAEQEFAHLASLPTPPAKTWRDMKGLSSVPAGLGLHVARALWLHRDATARARDTAPHALLSSRAIVDIARSQPRTPAELGRVRGFPARRRGAVSEWFDVIETAYAEPRSAWPEPLDRGARPPAKGVWKRAHPDSWEVLATAREAVAQRAAELSIAPEVLLTPALLRELVWDNPSGGDTDWWARALCRAGARRWQVDAVAPAVAAATRRAS